MPKRKPLAIVSGQVVEVGGADWVGTPRQLFRIGRFYSYARTGLFTTGSTLTGKINYMPWVIDQQVAFKNLRVEVTTLLAGGQIRCGLYADDGTGLPGTLVAGSDNGVMTSDTVGVKTITFASPITIQPGLYWVAFTNSAAIALRAFSASTLSSDVLGYSSTVGSGAGKTMRQSNFTFGAMPSTAPDVSSVETGANTPIVIFEV